MWGVLGKSLRGDLLAVSVVKENKISVCKFVFVQRCVTFLCFVFLLILGHLFLEFKFHLLQDRGLVGYGVGVPGRGGLALSSSQR